MKYYKLSILCMLATVFLLSCKAQNIEVINLTSNAELNYTLANISKIELNKTQLYNNSFYVNAFLMYDSKATPTTYFKETDEVMESLVISVTPDGDYYTQSKLYKIKGFINPNIEVIFEDKFPFFFIKVKHGTPDNRKFSTFKLEGIQD